MNQNFRWLETLQCAWLCLKVAVAIAEKRLQRSSQQSLVQCQNLSVSNASSSGKLDELKAESFYNVKYWNVNYYVKCLSDNCWFLVCSFFSLIWNISQINVFKTKCKLKCQNDFFGKLFLKSGSTSVYILCFHYWDLSDEHLTW